MSLIFTSSWCRWCLSTIRSSFVIGWFFQSFQFIGFNHFHFLIKSFFIFFIIIIIFFFFVKFIFILIITNLSFSRYSLCWLIRRDVSGFWTTTRSWVIVWFFRWFDRDFYWFFYWFRYWLWRFCIFVFFFFTSFQFIIIFFQIFFLFCIKIVLLLLLFFFYIIFMFSCWWYWRFYFKIISISISIFIFTIIYNPWWWWRWCHDCRKYIAKKKGWLLFVRWFVCCIQIELSDNQKKNSTIKKKNHGSHC